MINIEQKTRLNSLVFDRIIRVGIPAVLGVSTGGYGTIVHLPDDTVDQGLTTDIMDAFDTLVVTADKTAMAEGDADPVVSCNDVLIASDSDVGYIVLLDGVEYASGTDAVSAGVADLTLASPVAGVYEIFIYRRLGNYASGSITITVREV